MQGSEGSPSLLTTTAVSENIAKGQTYMFRYRAWNVNGPGAWSDVANLVAAQPPSRPPRPEYGSSTDTSVYLLLNPSEDDGGKIIQRIELEVSEYLQTNWQSVSNYDGQSLQVTLTTADDGLLSGGLYRFRTRSVNEYGNSAWSLELPVAVAPLPSKLDAPLKDQAASSSTAMRVTWTASSDIIPILSYEIRLTNVGSGEQVTHQTTRYTTSHTFTELTPGSSYAIDVIGYNFNGKGELWSDQAVFESCVVPTVEQLPIVTS